MPNPRFTAPRQIPAGARSFQSDDIDEVRAFFGHADGPAFRTAWRGERLGYQIYAVPGPRVSVGWSQSAVGQSVHGNVLGSVFLLQLPEGSVYRAGRRKLAPTSTDSVVMMPPRWECTRLSPPGGMFGFEVRQQVMEEELHARRDAPAQGVRPLALLQVGARERLALQAAATELMQHLNTGADARRVALAEARVIGLAADLSLQGSPAARPGELTLDRVRDLEGWIDAHLGEPITLGRLCQVAGVGDRCLQKAFERRRGVSPMRFVLERRLIATHLRLLDTHRAPGLTITDTAMAFGFSHLGRFSHDYRQLIGESPSQTLARNTAPKPLVGSSR